MDHKKLRVYDPAGDFEITIPADARVTFGYFNPAAAGDKYGNPFGHQSAGASTMKTTALRIYTKEKGEPETQLACFLGVRGFRDLDIPLTRLSNRVVIEENFEDDGEGTVQFNKKQKKQLVAVTEAGSYQ